VEILQHVLFGPQFTKLEFFHQRFQETVVAMPHLGQARFKDLLGGFGGTDAENLMANRVQEFAGVLTGLGKALADIIKNRSVMAQSVLRGGQFEPPAYPLPNEGEMIVMPESLSGRTVLAGLIEAVSLALLQGMLLVPGELAALLERETEIRTQLQPVREGIERLSSEDQLATLREAYPQLLGS
jgi:hypothetical protein